MAIVMRMTMMVTTTINSTKVKPRRPRRGGRLPGAIASPIGSLLIGFAVDIEDVLAAPTLRIRVVLIAAEAPFGLAGKGIEGDSAQEAHLLIFGVIGHFHAFNENIQRLGITVGALFDGSEGVGVGE